MTTIGRIQRRLRLSMRWQLVDLASRRNPARRYMKGTAGDRGCLQPSASTAVHRWQYAIHLIAVSLLAAKRAYTTAYWVSSDRSNVPETHTCRT